MYPSDLAAGCSFSVVAITSYHPYIPQNPCLISSLQSQDCLLNMASETQSGLC